MSKFSPLFYFDLSELFFPPLQREQTYGNKSMGHIINLDTCLSIVLVASVKGSDRLKHVPYHGVQRIVIKW